MKLDIAAALCKQFEGFRGKPYLCPAGIPTIGYGSTYYADGRKVALTDPPMSEPDATALLLQELHHTYLPAVLRQCPILLTDEKKCNAIVDFAYNLGTGRLQTRHPQAQDKRAGLGRGKRATYALDKRWW
jgi:lysozyme